MAVDEKTVRRLKASLENGEKHLEEFLVDIKDDRNQLVAQVKKVVYLRKKRPAVGTGSLLPGNPGGHPT